MRIFVGLDLADEIRERIAYFMAEVRALAPDVRWVTAESLHVTLKFIGEKPEELLDQIRESLASISAPSFSIAFRGCGFFPTPRAARVFWIGIEADVALAKLAGQIDDGLAELEIPKETRAFSPHLTWRVPDRERRSAKRGIRQISGLPDSRRSFPKSLHPTLVP